MSKPVDLGGRLVWRTRSAAFDYFRALRDGWASYQLIPTDHPDHEDLLALIANHPEADAKIGVGIRAFEVRPDEYRHRCFYLLRVDGTETEWSFKTAVKGEGTSLRHRWSEAGRNAIRPTIVEFRDSLPSVVDCGITGESVATAAAHIDHASPNTFARIVDAYIESHPDDYTLAVIEPPTDNQQATEFVDATVEERFKAFHDERCSLRAVTCVANLRRE